MAIAYVTASGEIGPEQRLHDSVLNALCIAEPDEPVCVPGVRRPFDPVKSEMNTICFADCGHIGVEFLRTFPASKLFRAIFLPAHSVLRHGRIQLKREPAYFDLSIKSSDRFFQPPFAD